MSWSPSTTRTKTKAAITVDDKLLKIAWKHLSIDTLETENNDQFDLTTHAVWDVKKALKAAYKQGLKDGEKKS